MEQETIRILLVEDNPADARLVKEAFSEIESPAFELTHASRLSEARRHLADGQFDVVLLDLVLPDKPRMGSLIEIHDQAKRVPIVVLTGMDDETMAEWTLEEGAQDYLVKGQTNPENLVRTIRRAIQRHKTQGEQFRHAPARFAATR